MNGKPIDVWDIESFDEQLISELHGAADLIRNYTETDQRQFLEREAAQHRIIHTTNPYAREYIAFQEYLALDFASRSIRAWHYSRLTDGEVQTLLENGIIMSSLEQIVRRINAQVDAGTFSRDVANRLFAASPFHNKEVSRSGEFWASSDPMSKDDSRVNLLLEHWGGEGVYFWQEEPDLVHLLQSIGTPRVIELSVPLDATDRASTAAGVVMSTFARSIGCQADNGGFSICVTRPLGPEAILSVHSSGDEAFENMGLTYPARFATSL